MGASESKWSGGLRQLFVKADERVRAFVRMHVEADLRVFVSYRHEAGPGQAHRLASDLGAQLGQDRVFLDEQSIPEGAAFDEVITERVGLCDVLLAVIGPGWLGAEGRDAPRPGAEPAERRLDNPLDYVRREIEAALARRVPVIPVTTPGATLPDRGALPESLMPLLDHPALRVAIPRDDVWVVAIDSLARWLVAIADEKGKRDKEQQDAASDRSKLERAVEKARQRLDEVGAAAAAAEQNRAALEQQVPVARAELDDRRREAEPTRAGPGVRVFISHLEGDIDAAARLEHDLKERLPADRVSGTEPVPELGDAAAVIDARIACCDALIAIIGPGWQQALTAMGKSIDRRDHPMEVEIEAALKRGVPIIPVLTQRAALPEGDGLPERLKPLLSYQAMPLPDQFWEAAVERLLNRFDKIEAGIEQRERAVSSATARHRELELDLQRAAERRAGSETALATAKLKLAELEERVEQARTAEQRLHSEPADLSPAYLAGPPPPRTVMLD